MNRFVLATDQLQCMVFVNMAVSTGFLKSMEFLDQMNDCQLSRKNSYGDVGLLVHKYRSASNSSVDRTLPSGYRRLFPRVKRREHVPYH